MRVPGWLCEKSTGSRYCDCVLAMYSTVALLPGAVIWMPFDVSGSPLPNKPIWLNGAVLQLEGWHTAVIVAEPGRLGETVPAPAEIVEGVVELNSRLMPVRVVPFASFTRAVSGWLVLTATVALLLLVPGMASWMDVGGQVEKKPAAPPVPEFETLAVTIDDPGCAAVATPFWSTVKTEDVWAEYCRWPIWQVTFWALVLPPSGLA